MIVMVAKITELQEITKAKSGFLNAIARPCSKLVWVRFDNVLFNLC